MAVDGPFFRPALFRFLRELRDNNDRTWFKAHQDRFEEDVRSPCLAFIEAAGPGLKAISPGLTAVPKKVGGSLMRIQRDTRFSKDKTPYKTNVAIGFGHEAIDGEGYLGFYLSLDPTGSLMAGGFGGPTPILNKVRDRIVAEPDRWAKVVGSVPALEDGDDLKTAPRGYDADHVHVADLRRKRFHPVVPYTQKQVTAPDFLDRFLADARACAPLNAFCAEAIGVAW